jgi:hypothetical protein
VTYFTRALERDKIDSPAHDALFALSSCDSARWICSRSLVNFGMLLADRHALEVSVVARDLQAHLTRLRMGSATHRDYLAAVIVVRAARVAQRRRQNGSSDHAGT